jgi:hypothetical protein
MPVSFMPGSTAVSTLQFDLTLPSALSYASTATGSAATAAGKSASANSNGNVVTVLIFGLNQNTIGSGPIAIVTLTIAAGAAPGTLASPIGNIAASTPNGITVATNGTNGSVTVNGTSDTTPPNISNIKSSNISQSSATISWATNEPADSQVEYGTTPSFGSLTQVDSNLATSHNVGLSGLTPNKMYYYRVRSRDAAGNLAVSSGRTFATASSIDITPPVISNVSSSNITSTSAVVTWTTNEPASSQVEYGLTTDYGSSTNLNPNPVTFHSRTITGLTPNTQYNYRAFSNDGAGNSAASSNFTFTTADQSSDTTPPAISGVSSTVVSANAVEITWSTDEASTSEVEFGPTASYGDTATNDSLTTSHYLSLTALAPERTYHYRVKSRDAAGNWAVSDDFSFQTPAPDVSEIQGTLFFPRLLATPAQEPGSMEEQFVGVALTNLDSKTALITFTALDANGRRVTGDGITNPASRTLRQRGQLPIIDWQLFGSAIAETDAVAYIKIESTVAKVAGFYMVFDAALAVLDGAVVSSDQLRSLIFPEIESEGFTRIGLINPDKSPSDVTVELMGGDGKPLGICTLTIDGEGAVMGDLFSDLFPLNQASSSDYVRVTSERGIVAFELVGKDESFISSLNGQSASHGDIALYSPQYVVGGPWRSALSIVNLDDFPGFLTFRLFSEEGDTIGVKSLPIGAHGKISITDQAFLADPTVGITQGYVQILSDGVKLAGSVIFGDPERNIFSAALPLVSRLNRSVLFSQVASNETYFMGIAIINPNGTAVNASIEVYNAAGELLTSGEVEIPARQRISQLLVQFFPELAEKHLSSGYVRIMANQEIAGFAVFGTKDLSVLSAIPPQIVP